MAETSCASCVQSLLCASLSRRDFLTSRGPVCHRCERYRDTILRRYPSQRCFDSKSRMADSGLCLHRLRHCVKASRLGPRGSLILQIEMENLWPFTLEGQCWRGLFWLFVLLFIHRRQRRPLWFRFLLRLRRPPLQQATVSSSRQPEVIPMGARRTSPDRSSGHRLMLL